MAKRRVSKSVGIYFDLPVDLMSLPRGRLIIPGNGGVGWQLRSEMPFLISARLKRLSGTKGAEVSRAKTRGRGNSNRCVAKLRN